MLAIRLTRVGKKNRPQYRIVVQEKSKAVSSNFLEKVGFYDPHDNSEKGLKLEVERIKYWMSQGAEVSATLHNILISKGVIEGKKIPKGRPAKKKDEEAEKKEGEAKPAEVKPEAPKAEKKEETKPEAVKEEPKAEEVKVEAPVEEKKEEVKEEPKPEEAK
ncbi:MAG: 30S ribosomal protein S16 [Patescibacteria group bacterium]|jgi:small subunit ribosomal protein S16